MRQRCFGSALHSHCRGLRYRIRYAPPRRPSQLRRSFALYAEYRSENYPFHKYELLIETENPVAQSPHNKPGCREDSELRLSKRVKKWTHSNLPKSPHFPFRNPFLSWFISLYIHNQHPFFHQNSSSFKKGVVFLKCLCYDSPRAGQKSWPYKKKSVSGRSCPWLKGL